MDTDMIAANDLSLLSTPTVGRRTLRDLAAPENPGEEGKAEAPVSLGASGTGA